ncbi:hypothetical protein [Streptosporangium sp. LJ11]|uniref:hypothetical protein n=1 Tax=Streptosporangium sp. LJ11 TaxID=3436927 RepID=UPI003F79C8E9
MQYRHKSAAVLTGAVAALALLGTATAAQAATGQVVVFSTEFQELTTWNDPTGCHTLPLGAHQLNNQTDGDIQVYNDPLCLTPVLTVKPGYGSHVPPTSGSFSA